jgi:hypothetical protein
MKDVPRMLKADVVTKEIVDMAFRGLTTRNRYIIKILNGGLISGMKNARSRGQRV